MPSWTKYLVAAGVLALVVVLVQTWRTQADDAAWELISGEQVRNGDVEAMESALVQVDGTTAEPVLAYMTAQRLFELGGTDNFDRAREIASGALAEFGTHSLGDAFEELVAAIDSYEVAPAENASLAGLPGGLGF